MRTYGRIPNPNGPGLVWVEVDTDENGYNDEVYLTTLCQVLLLNLGESPFYATYGIPAQQSVLQQTFPDYYVSLTQQAFAPYFASLLIQRTGVTANGSPVYTVTAQPHQGAILTATVAI